MNKINHTLYRGIINKQLRVVYQYQKKVNDKFPTMKDYRDTTYIEPSFSLTIGEPYGSPNRLFLPANNYSHFVLLLHKSIKLVQQHLLELFPNMNNTEFEIDSLVLERFTTEKAMHINGMTIIPCVWSNEANECYPAIQVNTMHGSCRIPLEDAMAIDHTLYTFDPLTFGLLMLNMIGY